MLAFRYFLLQQINTSYINSLKFSGPEYSALVHCIYHFCSHWSFLGSHWAHCNNLLQIAFVQMWKSLTRMMDSYSDSSYRIRSNKSLPDTVSYVNEFSRPFLSFWLHCYLCSHHTPKKLIILPFLYFKQNVCWTWLILHCLFLQGKENCARVIQSIELFTAVVFECTLLTLYFLKNIGNHFHWWVTMRQSYEKQWIQ